MSNFNFIPESDDRILEYLGTIGMVLCVLREAGIAGDGGEETCRLLAVISMHKWAINALLLGAC